MPFHISLPRLAFIFLLLATISVSAQNAKTDSLLLALEAAGHDTTRMGILNNLGRELKNAGEYERALKYASESVKLGLAMTGDPKLAPTVNKLLGKAYHASGLIYFHQGDFSPALDNYFKSLAIFERIADKPGMAASYNNIGNVYYARGDNGKALEFYAKSAQVREAMGDIKGVATGYTNMANIYAQQQEQDKALEFYFKAVKIFEANGYTKELAYPYLGISGIYDGQGDDEQAIAYLARAIALQEATGDKKGLVAAYNNRSSIYLEQSATLPAEAARAMVSKAKEESEKSLRMAREIGAMDDVLRTYLLLAKCDSALGDYNGAFEYHKLYASVKDSVFNDKSNRTMAEMLTRYETEKKQKEIELQKAEISKKEAVIQQQTTEKLAYAGGLVLVLVLAGVSYSGYRSKQKANALLTSKNAIIEEKNKDITDSINYARTIQQAILPIERHISRSLRDYFILFKPRDIVSGDFYWFIEKDNYTFIAVADCTGHGVPGAFMSMIGSSTLRHAVTERGITEPGMILSEVNRKIKEALKQSETNNRDGMDISLMRFEKNIMSQAKFAGAMRSLYHVSVELSEVKGDKMPIGGTTPDDHEYTTHEISLAEGDTLYMLSDGYADQFGGPEGKKFRTGSFKKLLLTFQDKPMHEQREILNEAFDSWKGNQEQVDDVCVVGVRI